MTKNCSQKESIQWSPQLKASVLIIILWKQVWWQSSSNGPSGADPGFGQGRKGGGVQLSRPKVADVAAGSHANEASYLQLGSRAHLRALEAFGVLMLEYAFSHILETLFL